MLLCFHSCFYEFLRSKRSAVSGAGGNSLAGRICNAIANPDAVAYTDADAGRAELSPMGIDNGL